MGSLFKDVRKGVKSNIAEEGRWLFAESAIVADNDDPEKQHRIRVVIPSIDENLIFDEWVRPAAFCLGDGFGTVFIPPKGAEVIVTGALGQKFNLFYFSTFNEAMLIPPELSKNNPGIHAPNNLQFIAEQVMKLLAQEIQIIAQHLAKLQGENVTVEATQLSEIKGNEIKLNGATITVNGNGSISISGGNISISGDNVTIQNRLVQKNGMPI